MKIIKLAQEINSTIQELRMLTSHRKISYFESQFDLLGSFIKEFVTDNSKEHNRFVEEFAMDLKKELEKFNEELDREHYGEDYSEWINSLREEYNLHRL